MQKSLKFIGIDISKSTLDICALGKDSSVHYQIENQALQIRKFFRTFTKNSTRICFENTGKYGWVLIEILTDLGFKFYQVNALHLKRSMGLVRGKNDVVDALRIAQFISKNYEETPLYQTSDKNIKKIQVLISKRNLLVKQRAQHKTLKKENELIKSLKLPVLEKYSNAIISLLNKHIKEIEKMINTIIAQDQILSKNHRIATSVPGVGKIVSWNMLVKTNGYKGICNPRKFACYAGVAPFSQRSGTSINKKARVSHLADKTMKKLLHMAAMRAIQLENDLKKYYIRKVNQGKNKMLVLNAVRNKITHRIFAMVKSEKLYDFNLHMS
jgi:transposase